MTALKQYDKLESTGLWRASQPSQWDGGSQPQRREVYVTFGDTSLMIRNKAGDPVSHWSLPAVERLNPGQMPALFAPSGTTTETLEIEDETMVAAIEKVRVAIERRRPHPGRLRIGILITITTIIAGLAIFWLPGALERQAVRIVPYEKRQEIGRALLADITQLSGKPCTTRLGAVARDKLAARMFDGRKGTLVILPQGIAKSAILPGRIVLLNRMLVEDFEGPEVAAGYIAIELVDANERDPLARMLDSLGGLTSFRLLTTGNVTPNDIRAYARTVLTRQSPMPDTTRLLAKIASLGFASSPLAYEIDISGETTLPLIEADPYQNKPYPALLSDNDWISLQAICGG